MGIGGFLKKVAPWIGTAAAAGLSGNVPALVNLAAKAVSSAVGKDVSPDMDSLEMAVANATPEQIIALKKQDLEFQAQMKAMEFKQITDLEAIAAGDRASAREMQKSTRSIIPALLATIITLGFFTLLTGMMLGKLHVSDAQAMLIMLGSLTTAFGMVVMFYFGSSAGSQTKDELLHQSVPVSKGEK